ncbi:putative receptor-like GPI-anchored protein 2 [Trifolium pratense]|uniref:Putative receptor-like GPI-anchored protein 2 n=2 Tax=Trifolium pratense TaxID=57577 RepID=A0A2K3M632_TRIPR|nr:putative receptor-like GPI-anchored protein 2 [Trifolium pratense]PNX86234.1 putative receptor-like GPI-anchored protein 2 [Trifolium pratense]
MLQYSCNRTVCDYSGYTSSNISTVLVTQNACAVTPSSGGGDSDSGASRSILNGWVWNKLLVLIHFLLFFVYLL